MKKGFLLIPLFISSLCSCGTNNVTLTSIDISGNYLTSFELGESYTSIGMIVMKNYSDSSRENTNSYTTSLYEGYVFTEQDVSNHKEIVVSVTENATTVTASYFIEVTSKHTKKEVTDTFTSASFPAKSNDTYVDFNNVKGNSEAIYCGNSAKSANGNIQLRWKTNKEAGIYTSISGGTLVSISVEWDVEEVTGKDPGYYQERDLCVFAKKTAYTSVTDMVDGDEITKLHCSHTSQDTTYTFGESTDFTYIGLRSLTGALYLKSITINWLA